MNLNQNLENQVRIANLRAENANLKLALEQERAARKRCAADRQRDLEAGGRDLAQIRDLNVKVQNQRATINALRAQLDALKATT